MNIFIKLLSVFIIYLFLVSSINAQSHISQDIRELKNWEKYIDLIDTFIENNKSDTQKLWEIQDKLQVILKNFEWNKYLSVFEYLDQEISIILEITIIWEDINIIVEEAIEDTLIEDQETWEDDNVLINNNNILFQWFWEYYNDQDKNILAWTEVEIYSADINVRLEEIDVWQVFVYIKTLNPEWLKNSIEEAKLYLEWSLLDISSWWKIDVISSSQIKIEFNNLNDFILTRNQREYRISIKTHTIWEDNLWEIVEEFYVNRVWFDEIKWLTTWDNLNNIWFNSNWANNTIIPVELNITQDEIISIDRVGFNISWNYWDNFLKSFSQNRSLEIQKLIFRPFGSSNLEEYTYRFVNVDNISQEVIWTFNNWFLEFNLSWLSSWLRTINDSTKWEDFEVYITHPTRSDTINLNLQRDWISFELLNQEGTFNTKYETTIDFISKPN